jgi:hypothetical protein
MKPTATCFVRALMDSSASQWLPAPRLSTEKANAPQRRFIGKDKSAITSLPPAPGGAAPSPHHLGAGDDGTHTPG